ncbi:MAG: hypothetical protein IPK00_14405 [Deltaproteobacteria bacterium]|nr:hypothetical protein [Deltaproteobacteria bacterium]
MSRRSIPTRPTLPLDSPRLAPAVPAAVASEQRPSALPDAKNRMRRARIPSAAIGELARWAGLFVVGLVAGLALPTLHANADASAPEAEGIEAVHPCEAGATLATGRPDPALFAYEASRGVQAFWCETYDADGRADRAGPYWDLHPNGATRVRARYTDSRIDGPVEVFDEDGTLWLHGALEAGAWNGPLELFHPNGARWLAARFRAGVLDGPVETWFPDGSLESQTNFQDGREDGIASSFYPTAVGGGLRSQVRVEGDQIVDRGPQIVPAEPTPAEAMPGPLPMAQREIPNP